MAKNNLLNRMGRTDQSKKDRRVRKHGGHDEDSDSSVDSSGNIRDLIDYDSEEEDDDYVPRRRPVRKAAVLAKKRIDKELRHSNKRADRELKKKNTVYYPEVRRKPKVDRRRVVESESEEEVEETEEESEEQDEAEDEDLEETEEQDEEEEEQDEVDEEEGGDEDEDLEEMDEDEATRGLFTYILKMGGGQHDTMVPKKYNMKKESSSVKKFVELLTSPVEENTIDTQIDQFKQLSDEKQKELIVALENRPTASGNGFNLMLNILTMKLPKEIQATILAKYNSLQTLEASSNEYFKLRAWLDKVVSIPFGVYKDIPVRLEDGSEKCGAFMETAKKCLDDAVYGQDESKLQIMQFICSKIANPDGRGLCLLLAGPPGIGKTSLIKNGIAKALGWPFQFISLGGDSDASTYTGHQLVYESSHCGKIVNSLIASKSMSTVLMFDEVDKISQTPKGEEVMNLLIHLTDPVQNGDFEDKYLSGVPIDLSKVMFVFSANDINKIDKVLLDRMLVIDLKGYDLKQKTVIAEQYLLPTALKEVNLHEKVSISKEILTKVIEEYAKEEKGVRELKRSIEQMTQKINMLRMYNSPQLPFYIKDFSLPFIVKKDHVPLFIKKKEVTDAPPQNMYM
jgi:ATP-dependent Lon protease